MGIFVLVCVGIGVLLYVSRDGIKATPNTIESLLGSFYVPEKMGGFAVSVFSKDSILYSKGFGYSDIEKKIPYTTKTQQYIYKILISYFFSFVRTYLHPQTKVSNCYTRVHTD